MAKSEWIELNTPDATLRIKLDDKLKRTIEKTYESGYDPETYKPPSETSSSLVLPESCIPKVEENVVVGAGDKSDFEICQEIKNIIRSAKTYEVVAFDFTNERYIELTERVLNDMKDYMKQKHLSFRLTQRMMEAVKAIQLQRWEKRG